jgi:hypothetical protein
MFTSQQLSACRSEDGSYNFKIKLVASMFADEVSFPASMNLKHTLEDLNSRFNEAFSGSPELIGLLEEPTIKL